MLCYAHSLTHSLAIFNGQSTLAMCGVLCETKIFGCIFYIRFQLINGNRISSISNTSLQCVVPFSGPLTARDSSIILWRHITAALVANEIFILLILYIIIILARWVQV